MHSEAKMQRRELLAFLNLHLQCVLVEHQHAPSPESSVRTVVGGSWYNLDAYSPKEAFLLPLLTPESCPAFCPDVRRAGRGPWCTAPSTPHHRSPRPGRVVPHQCISAAAVSNGRDTHFDSQGLAAWGLPLPGSSPLIERSPCSPGAPAASFVPPPDPARPLAPSVWAIQKGSTLLSFTRGGQGAPKTAGGRGGAISPWEQTGKPAPKKTTGCMIYQWREKAYFWPGHYMQLTNHA